MGSSISSLCPRRDTGPLAFLCPKRTSLADLGVPDGYDWEGLPQDLIDAYYEAKDKVLAQVETRTGETVNTEDGSWRQSISQEEQELLKMLLLKRAVGLVHVLGPIEEQRHGLRTLTVRGYVSEAHRKSLEHADEACQFELKSIMEESHQLVPEAPPNGIIQAAAQEYHRQKAMEEAAANGGEAAFEDVKRGFLGSSSKAPEKLVHGFTKGQEVEAHSLKTESMNGARGRVKGTSKGDRVTVTFPPPLGEKAVKPINLRPAPPLPDVNPDAEEAPVAQFQVVLERALKEPLGLSFDHEPPLNQQKENEESCLLITGVLDDGFVKKYNSQQQDPQMCLRPGDRILGVMNGMVPEKLRKPVHGNSKRVLDVIDTGVAPLIFLVGRVLGPPLRFRAGHQVKANCGDKGWLPGIVVKVWEEKADRVKVPYVIRLRESGNVVFAPKDFDEFCVKGDPRFQVGDDAMCNHGGCYKPARIISVCEKKTSTSYKARIGDIGIDVPSDLNQFIRPIARFGVGSKVAIKMSEGFAPGTVEAVYNPGWVYAVKLDAGSVAYVPEDVEGFVRAR